MEEEKKHVHIHIDEDGNAFEHEHTHDHSHESVHEDAEESTCNSHGHHHTNTKAVVNRLSRAIGHLEAVKKMVEDGRDCSEVLIQLAAVRSAINNTGKVILEDHIEHCIVEAVENGDSEAIDKLNKAINQFVK